MRTQNVKTTFFFAILFACISSWAQQATQIPVTIRVSDESGAVVGHARVRFDPAPPEVPSSMETDNQGRVFVNLKPGTYTIFVSEAGFKEASQHIGIGVADGPAAGQTVSVVLQVAHLTGMVVYSGDSLLLTGDPSRAPIRDQPSIALTPTEFHALPHVTLTAHNSHTDANETYSGVPLATLLAKINAPSGNELRGNAMTSYLVATGSDGYAVVLSLAEVDPGFRDTQVIVADTRDGQPLGKNGPFQLIVQGDKRPARWVRNLVSISLNRTQ